MYVLAGKMCPKIYCVKNEKKQHKSPQNHFMGLRQMLSDCFGGKAGGGGNQGVLSGLSECGCG